MPKVTVSEWSHRAVTGPSKHTLEPRPHLVFPELVDNGFMEEESDVFDEVKSPGCRGALVNLLLVFGFMGINALQDTQPPARQRPFLLSINTLSLGNSSKQGTRGRASGEVPFQCRCQTMTSSPKTT